MTSLSTAAILAWKIAMLEAMKAGSEYLEKEHLLIGLYSLEKVLSLQDFARNAQAARQVLDEKDALDFPLRNSGMDATMLRRRVRQALPRGEQVRRGSAVHRSPDCRKYFDRASQLANGKEITCVHLLNAILENPGPIFLSTVDGVSVAGRQSGDPEQSVTMRMMQSVRVYRKEQINKQSIFDEIENTRQTLSIAPKDSQQFRVLKQELVKKTLILARICLDVHDINTLLPSLKDLVHYAGESEYGLADVIAQLEYMRKEGIGMGEKTAGKIRDILDRIERKI